MSTLEYLKERLRDLYVGDSCYSEKLSYILFDLIEYLEEKERNENK